MAKKGEKTGKYYGGGMPAGHKTPRTIQKEEAKAIMREMIIAELGPIVRAGIKSAVGVDHMMLRNEEDGTFRRLTELSEIERALNHPGAKEGSTYWIHTKDPNIPALITLLDRAVGKPVEEQRIEVSGTVGLVDTLRKRKANIGS